METAGPLSKTAKKVSNDELGSLQRRTNELVRRIEDGTLELSWVMAQLQLVIEGKRVPDKVYLSRATPREFERLPEHKRGRSVTPLEKRLPESFTRLDFPQRNMEHVMAEMWEAENIPRAGFDHGSCPAWVIMGGTEITDRDIQVMSSTLQWLGTNVGSDFLRRFLQVSQMHI